MLATTSITFLGAARTVTGSKYLLESGASRVLVDAGMFQCLKALRGYTAAGAYAVFADDRRGIIRPGYDADLVVLDRDLTRVPSEELDQARVRRTIVGGRTVFAAP